MQKSEYKTPIPNTNNVKQCDIGPGHSSCSVVNKSVISGEYGFVHAKKQKQNFEHLL